MKNAEPIPLVADEPSPQNSFPRTALVLDIGERLLILAVYGQFVVRLLHLTVQSLNIGSILLVMSESIPLFFLVVRRFSTRVSRDPFDWSVAIIGSTIPLMIIPNATGAPLLPMPACDAIIMLGLCIQIAAKVSLGRSFGIVAANRGVESTGPYRFVLNTILYGLAFCLQIVRLLREERVLIRDPLYQSFSQGVRYRLIPGVF